jgi:hypothetical protein
VAGHPWAGTVIRPHDGECTMFPRGNRDRCLGRDRSLSAEANGEPKRPGPYLFDERASAQDHGILEEDHRSLTDA